MCSALDDPTTYDTRTCDARLWVRGEDRRCGQSVGLVLWNDSEGRGHAGCKDHYRGLLRRHPETLPERSDQPHGRLSLLSPWARSAFGPTDRIVIEDSIPSGYTVSVLMASNRSGYTLWLIHDGVEVSRIERRDPIAACYELIRAVAS